MEKEIIPELDDYIEPITKAQRDFLTYNFPWEFTAYFDQITKYQARKFISEVEHARKHETNPVNRQFALNTLADNFKKTLGPARCNNCKKPTEPINDVNSCSC